MRATYARSLGSIVAILATAGCLQRPPASPPRTYLELFEPEWSAVTSAVRSDFIETRAVNLSRSWGTKKRGRDIPPPLPGTRPDRLLTASSEGMTVTSS